MSVGTATMTEPTPTQALIMAKAILATPAQWCQGAVAKSATDVETCTHYPDAYSFCAFGAVTRAMDILYPTDGRKYYRLLDICTDFLRAVGMEPSVNDAPHTTFEDVHRAFDKAIALSMEPSP